MTIEEFENLSDEQLRNEFRPQAIVIDKQRVSVNVERTLLRPEDDPQGVTAWAGKIAAAAQHLNDNGTVRHAGGTLAGRWTFIYLVRHHDGAVMILNAAVPDAPMQ